MSTDPSNRTHVLTKFLIAIWFVAVLVVLNWSFPEFWRDAQDEFEEGQQLRAAGDLQAAVPWIEKAIRMDPENAGYHIALANLQLELGQPERAAVSFGHVLEMRGNDREALFGLLSISVARGDQEGARAYAARLATLPLQSAQLLRRARACAQLGMIDQALEDIRELLKEYPEAAGLLHEAAQLESAKGLFADAAAHYDALSRAVTDEAERHDALLGKAVSLRAQGEPAAAYAAFKDVEGRDTAQARAELASELKVYDEAEALYTELIAADPSQVTNIQTLATLYEAQGKYAAAVSLLTEYREPLTAIDPHLSLRLADLYRWSGHCELSAAGYRAYLETPPDGARLAQAREGLVRALIDSGEGAMARDALQPLLDAEPGNPTYQLLAARAAALDNDAPRVVLHLEKIAALRELTALESLWLAGQYRQASQPAKALKAYNDAFAGMGAATPLEAVVALGDLRADVADWRGALAAYRVAQQVDPALDLNLKMARVAQHVQGEGTRAAEAYLRYAKAHPDDLAGQWEAVDYLSQVKHFDAAVELLECLLEAVPGETTAAAIRLGDLKRWQRQYPEAVRWYRVAIAGAETREASWPARRGLLMCLVDTGDSSGADTLGGQLAKEAPGDAEVLLLAARAADLAEQPARTVAYLEQLAALRELSLAERTWLAGRYRAAERGGDALRAYNALFAEHRDELPDEVLAATGDLRYDFRDWDGAVEAYSAVRSRDEDPRLQLKLARAVQKRDPKATAIVQAYRAYLARYPEDWDVTLEAARVLVNLGEREDARVLYLRYIEARGEKGLGVELARALLSGGKFSEAETWARKALDENPEDWQAKLALAQSLHLQGHPFKAAKIIDDNEDEFRRHADGLHWLGLVAMARDRHLSAFRIFDQLVQDPETARREHWIWRGRSAMRLRNFGIAEESYARAAAMGGLSPDDLEAEKQRAERAIEQIRDADAGVAETPAPGME